MYPTTSYITLPCQKKRTSLYDKVITILAFEVPTMKQLIEALEEINRQMGNSCLDDYAFDILK